MSKTLAALLLGILMGATAVCLADANSEYSAGANYAKQLAGQGENTLSQVNPGNIIPNYNSNPKEKDYYGGVTSGDAAGLKNAGENAWSNTEVGKAVNDSVINNKAEPISIDTPFIKNGIDIQDRADSIIGNAGFDCKAEEITRSEFTNYICERDTQVLRTCERAAEVGGHYDNRDEVRSSHFTKLDIIWWRDGKYIRGQFKAPFTGPLNSGSLYSESLVGQKYLPADMKITIWGNVIWYDNKSWGGKNLNVNGISIVEGQLVDITIELYNLPLNDSSFIDGIVNTLKNGNSYLFNIDFRGLTNVQFWVPTTSVPPACPLAQEVGAVLVNTVCSEPGGERWVTVNGISYPVSTSCWRFTDTYRLQETNEGNCGVYAKNPACIVATKGCAFNDEFGGCLRENVTYSCEKKTIGKVMLCGGETFCLDGECDKAKKGTQGNDFQKAVSELAAVAAAGKNVAELNGVNVRAFTGSARFCKKSAAGFSNCCVDSGWGQNIGLASCTSEEKALGKAKENLLTVSTGEFCSKKLLGVCLEKKRSYCQFDSKLAQIVQQQGRNWQLGIGFGGADNPDCRGITVEELQRINFDRLDFSNFYNDLIANQKVPNNDVLLERVRNQLSQVNK
ncbi:type-F conjugative transfer system mating-pair stabilization protein TraN [Serratia sp. S1B]|nr:type-F conjugative transfer system mating-pair stabilization protein TraN [Serratia sp. S1B]